MLRRLDCGALDLPAGTWKRDCLRSELGIVRDGRGRAEVSEGGDLLQSPPVRGGITKDIIGVSDNG